MLRVVGDFAVTTATQFRELEMSECRSRVTCKFKINAGVNHYFKLSIVCAIGFKTKYKFKRKKKRHALWK